jgi:hypothetical protein
LSGLRRKSEAFFVGPVIESGSLLFGFVVAGLVPATPIVWLCAFTIGTPGENAFTRIFDALCPATAARV